MGAIEISLHMVNGWVELTIQDNGIGLPEEVNWENPSSLGLSLVYALAVEQLEGRIEVSRQPKTAFTITFPQWMA
jgi:two-component sensor histidine kinase